ncbi:MAG: PASTA domain-containing protein [Baekduia sp.]
MAPDSDLHEAFGAGTIDTGATDGFSGSTDVDGMPRLINNVDKGAAGFFAPTVGAVSAGAGPTFTASVTPNGFTTTVAFEFGATTAYGSIATAGDLPADSVAHAVSVVPPGLGPFADQHFRVRASQGTVNYTRTVTSDDGFYAGLPVPAPGGGESAAAAGSATPAAVGVDKRCKVPNLKGLTRTGARKRLAGAGCAIGKVRGRSGGRVKSQTKKAGTNVAAGTKVGITLAKKTKAKKRAKR